MWIKVSDRLPEGDTAGSRGVFPFVYRWPTENEDEIEEIEQDFGWYSSHFQMWWSVGSNGFIEEKQPGVTVIAWFNLPEYKET